MDERRTVARYYECTGGKESSASASWHPSCEEGAAHAVDVLVFGEAANQGVAQQRSGATIPRTGNTPAPSAHVL